MVSTLSTRIAIDTCYRHEKWAPNLHGSAAPPKSKLDNTPSQEISIPAVFMGSVELARSRSAHSSTPLAKYR